MDYRPTSRHHDHDIIMMITHHDLYMTFSRESYYPILRTLQCCGLLFKIVGEELVHYNSIIGYAYSLRFGMPVPVPVNFAEPIYSDCAMIL